jgi:hypothetical protein
MKEKLKEKLDIEIYTNMVIRDNKLIPNLLDIVEEDNTSVKFMAEKVLRKLSEENPDILYSYFDRIFKLLDTDNSFVKWGIISTIPNLLSVDTDNKWEKVSDKYLSLLESTSVIEYGNVVSNIDKIFDAYPDYEDDIIPRLLDVVNHSFLYGEEISKECNNIAIGHVIECFTKIYDKSKYQSEIKNFIEKNKNNSRVSVKSKAAKFLKKYK